MKKLVLVALAATLACGIGAVTVSAQTATGLTANAPTTTAKAPAQCKAKQRPTLAKPCSYRWDRGICAELVPLIKKTTGLNLVASSKTDPPLYLSCGYAIGDSKYGFSIIGNGGWTKAKFTSFLPAYLKSSPCNPDESPVAPLKPLKGLGSVAYTWDPCPVAGYYHEVGETAGTNQHTLEALNVTYRWSVTSAGQLDQLVPMSKLAALVRQLMVLYP